jgi:serine phosphatase RsbU (regulator of sigma subunit)
MLDPHPQTMTCMEVWGGNTLTANAVSISGLDAWVYSKPFASADSGGDVYYLSSCATGRITRILLADVSGHGTAVTDTAATLRNLMRRYVNHLDQRTFVQSLNTHFTSLSATNTFATAVVATFFGPSNDLTLSNAGHPTPLLYRATTNTWSLLQHTTSATEEITDIPLGIDHVATYDQLEVSLHPNDLVLCYSDSLIEAHDPAGTLLGENGLLRVAQQFPTPDPATLIAALLQKLAALHPDNLTEDDVTILLFRPNHTRPAPGFFTRAYAPLRILARSLLSLLPNQGPAPLPELSAQNLLGISPRKK